MKASGKINKQIMIKGKNEKPTALKMGRREEGEGQAFVSDSRICGHD